MSEYVRVVPVLEPASGLERSWSEPFRGRRWGRSPTLGLLDPRWRLWGVRRQEPAWSVSLTKLSQISLSNFVVLGWHHTNTPQTVKNQFTPIIDGCTIGLTASNAVLRTGEGDR